MLRITTQVDYNDGDYNTNITTITEEKLEELMPLINAIKENGGDFGMGDVCETDAYEKYTEEFGHKMVEELEQYFSYGDCGYHSVDSIKVSPYVEEEELL